MIYDVFMFHNEFDMLEIRLKELEPYIDLFVLVESNKTFSGKDKPLYFTENKERYSKYNIKVLIMDNEIESKDPWVREHFSRNHAMPWIKENLKDDDIFLSSDLDEIPDFRNIDMKSILDGSMNTPIVLENDLFYYNMKWLYPNKWPGTIILRKKDIINNTLVNLRINSRGLTKISNGWHLSYFMDENEICNKIKSFSHQELNTEEYNNVMKHKARIMLGIAITDTKEIISLVPARPDCIMPRTYDEFPSYIKN